MAGKRISLVHLSSRFSRSASGCPPAYNQAGRATVLQPEWLQPPGTKPYSPSRTHAKALLTGTG
jgi:hypothetical protein